jgi:hypothetical protein
VPEFLVLKPLIIFVFLFAGFAHADTVLFLGSGVRFDSEASGASTSRSYPLRLGVGQHLSPKYTLGADLSRYVNSSTAGSVDITDEHVEFIFWLRGSLWARPTWLPYASFNLGVQQDSVTTKFQNDTSENRGKFEWVTGLGIGTYNEFWRGLGAGFEIRGLYRPWASPRYSADFIATLGWLF